ncbi:MAG: DUF1302 domain-containing protein [bacterium]|jgi:hypothetical protein
MKTMSRSAILIGAIALMCAGTAHAFQFQASDSIKGSLDMQLTLGAGMRLLNPNPGMTGDPTRGGRNTEQWSNGDDGNLNYKKGDFFTTYLKFTPELLLKFPDDYKFMARGTALYDFKATDTRRTDLADDAKDQAARDVRLLDLWVSKDLNVGSQRARVRVGNQVISWGESIFAIGGINSTNALDFQKFTTPGTQIKEAVIPAPIVSVASGLGNGVNAEVYYQFRWNRNRLPPVGTYFSVADILGKGRQPFFVDVSGGPGTSNFGGLDLAAGGVPLDFETGIGNTLPVPFRGDVTPKNSGQYGAAVHYKPEGIPLDMGFYFMNYHDKMPVLSLMSDLTAQWTYLENRKLYGVSANFPVGNWAVGWELSYRPKDAIALSSCFGTGGPLDANINPTSAAVDCPMYIDQKKYQMHLTGILSLTPGDHGWMLDLLHADTATFTGEAVGIRYPGLSANKRFTRDIGGTTVVQVPAAGYAFWKGPRDEAGFDTVAGAGTENSFGYTVDFNWAYDNRIIKGWTVLPGVTWFQAVKGDTPTLTANYLEGAKSMNIYFLFNQNAPTRWQAGLNYTSYWGGGRDHLRQPLGDRDFVGGFITRNF